jgi:hypothetical protein
MYFFLWVSIKNKTEICKYGKYTRVGCKTILLSSSSTKSYPEKREEREYARE